VKKSELSRITDELSKAQQSLQTLIKERRRLEGEIGQAREKLSAVLQKLNQAISADERFQRIGLEKLAQLAQFIESFEALGFDVETVRKLAEWKRALAVMGINPNTLEQYIKEKGPLEIELRNLKEKVERLKKLVETLEKAKAELLRSNASLSHAKQNFRK
jgi:predicted  nucleic acid-binding Zn-ribbon protein